MNAREQDEIAAVRHEQAEMRKDMDQLRRSISSRAAWALGLLLTMATSFGLWALGQHGANITTREVAKEAKVIADRNAGALGTLVASDARTSARLEAQGQTLDRIENAVTDLRRYMIGDRP